MSPARREERLAALHRLEVDAQALAGRIDREIPPWDDADPHRPDPHRPDPLRDAHRSLTAALRAIRHAIAQTPRPDALAIHPRFPVQERRP